MPAREARNVIDNDKVVLKDELEAILPKTSTASIAVGYFFISGFAAILKALKEADKIRLLISIQLMKKLPKLSLKVSGVLKMYRLKFKRKIL